MSSEPQHLARYGTSHALIVGINSYADPRFVPLGQAEKDASEVAALLSAPPYNFQISLLLGQQATRQAILAELHKLRRTKPDDRIVVYFAGHGYTLTDLYSHETGYLAAADTIPDQDYTALEMDEVTGLIKNAYAKHIAFIFDACFSGQALGLTRAPAIAAEKYLLRKAFQVLSAGAGDQTVSDFRSMTRTMIEALKSGVISRDGLVTFSELGLYVQQLIAADSGQTQIPQFGHLRGSQGGDFIFYREEGVRLPPTLVDGLNSELPNTRRGAVADLMNLAHGSDAALAVLARERLHQIAESDPNERVRTAAQRFFETAEAPVTYDSAQDVVMRTPPPNPEQVKSTVATGDLSRLQAAKSEPSAIRETVRRIDTQRLNEALKKPDQRKMQNLALFGIGAAIVLTCIVGVVLAINLVSSALKVADDPQPTPDESQSQSQTPEGQSQLPDPQNQLPTDEPTPTNITQQNLSLLITSEVMSRSEDPYIALMNSDGSNKFIIGSGGSPTWSPTGEQFAFACGIEICIYDLKAQASTTSGPVAPDVGGTIYDLDWAPDGREIVFVTSTSDSLADIFRYNISVDSTTQLTTNFGFDTSPVWINTESIGFLSDGPTQQTSESAIYYMLPDGSLQTLVLSGQGDVTSLDFGSNSYLYIAANAIYLLPHGASEPTLVLHGDPLNLSMIEVQWSADDQQIFFTAAVGEDHSDLYVVNPDGTGLLQITKTSDISELRVADQPIP